MQQAISNKIQKPLLNLDATRDLVLERADLRSELNKHTSFNKSNLALCVFHDEKTPSFYEKNGLYHCKGCDVGGNIINFIRDFYKKNYAEALLYLCAEYNIEAVWSNDLDAELYQKVQGEKKAAIDKISKEWDETRKAIFSENGIEALNYLVKIRGLSEEFIRQWGLGFNSNYNSISIPLINEYGSIVGISSRSLIYIPGSGISKYYNPPTSNLYNKSNFLFGLYQAIISKAFYKCKTCFLVEGYFDLFKLVLNGMLNVVALCGKSPLKEHQINLLKKKGIEHIILLLDCDGAGIEASKKMIDLLLQQNIRVDIIPFEDSKDIDEYIDKYKNQNTSISVHDHLIGLKVDAIEWKAKKEVIEAGTDRYLKDTAIKNSIKTLSFISSSFIRNDYIKAISNILGIKPKDLEGAIKNEVANIELENKPKAESNNSEENQKGFYILDTIEKGKPVVGYFTSMSIDRNTLLNFIITPHFLIYNGTESRYLLSIYNGHRKSMLEVPAKVITSIEQFQAYVINEGNFLIFANKNLWLRIASDLLQQFPRCIEITKLGWQPFGFFTYLDKVYIPGEGLKDLDNMGMFTYKGENFLITASCEAFKQLQRISDDPYETDRCLIYKTTHINFSQWAMQMQKVYLDKGVVAVAYAILTIFKDLVAEVDGNNPHLYAFGEPSSGKSKLFESLTALFFYKRAAFNVNSGTDFAFFYFMGSFRNCFAHFNEFDIEVINQAWFQAFKAAYDLEGRQRGKIGNGKNKTETMKPESTIGLTGQKLVTADDNSLLQRSLIMSYSITEKSEEQIKDYNILKQWEANGQNSLLTELLEYRPQFENEYKEQYKQQLGYWRKSKADVQQVNQRVLQNWGHLATCYNLISQHITLPQPAEKFTEYCYQQAMHWSHFIHSSDTISEFWKTIEFLINEQFPKIVYGFDYTVETVMQVTIRVSRKQEETITFQQPTKILFLRLNNVHTLFEMSFKSRKGKEAMSLDNLKHYFSSRKYNLGAVRQKWFSRFIVSTEKINGIIETSKKEERINSSCHAFLYDELDLNIEKFETMPPNDELPFIN